MEEKNKAFKEFIIEASADAKRFLDSLTSEANRLEYLNSKVESSDGSWKTILNTAKGVLDDADGDVHQVNELSEKIYKHEGIDEAYHECYADLLSLNLIVKSCMLQAKRIEGFAMEIIGKYGVRIEGHTSGMVFEHYILDIPNYQEVIDYITSALIPKEDKKDNLPEGEVASEEDVELMEEKEIEPIDNDTDYKKYIVGEVDDINDLPAKPQFNNSEYEFVKYDEEDQKMITYYWDTYGEEWMDIQRQCSKEEYNEFLMNHLQKQYFTGHGTSVFSFVEGIQDLPKHNKKPHAVWGVLWTFAKDHIYDYYEWKDDAEDGTPYYAKIPFSINEEEIFVYWNGYSWINGYPFSVDNCDFITVVKSYNELEKISIPHEYPIKKTPVAFITYVHDDGNETWEAYAYSYTNKGWVHGIFLPGNGRSTKECAEEFIHDWKTHKD